MVDKGVPIPMDQIIIFPYRKPCTFFEGGEEAEREMRPDKGTEPDLIPRTWSQMLSGVGAPTRDDDAGIPLRAKWTGLAPGAHVLYRPGDEPKTVRVGRVLTNSPDAMQVHLHQYRGEWTGITVTWTPLFISHDGSLTTEILDVQSKVCCLYSQKL